MNLVAQGKTKRIYRLSDGLVEIRSKDDITKNDDKSQTQIMEKKAEHATKTTSMVFELLKEAGIPVAFMKQVSPTAFLAPECKMIALEVVMRRYAVGSYLKRYPNLEVGAHEVPYRFHRLAFELFLKTTDGKIIMKDGKEWGETTIDPKTSKPVDDPFIKDPYSDVWLLRHPKIPEWEKDSDILRLVLAEDFLPEGVTVKKIEEIARKVFLVLEGAWAQLGFRLIDFKIEFGIDNNGNLLVADVIDNDSWRLRSSDWKEVSKQLFRENADMAYISSNYELVARLVEQFRIPKQAIVFWRGSEKDPLLDELYVAGVELKSIVMSGHKSPQQCLGQLESILAEFSEGGAIIPFVGMSNGLGPVLAARTSWPVIGVSATADTHPDDMWSSLRLPSQVPMLAILSKNNAVLAALNILAQKNPAAYMYRQSAIEELDK